MVRKLMLLAAVGALGLILFVTPGQSAQKFDPGVTANSIHIGATYPLTGPVGGVYGTITRAVAAYNKNYFNDTHQTINGRQLQVTYIDDQYNPSLTKSGTVKLVQQDHVFAIVGALGTAPNEAIQGYLNKLKVPQVLIATGDAFWSLPCAQVNANGTLKGNPPANCPATRNKTGHYWTFGGLGTYAGEAKLFAQYLNQHDAGAKVGVLYQNDAYGIPYLAALTKYLKQFGGKVKIQKAVPYSGAPGASTDMSQQVLQLKNSGANVLYNIALPLQSISALVSADKEGWKRKATVVNAVAASGTFMEAAGGAGASINGDLSDGIGPNPNDPQNAGLPAIKQYKQIMKNDFSLASGQTLASATADANNYAGVAGAWLTIQVLKKSGNPPTRAGLMNALTHLNITNDPYLFKGYKIHTTPTDRFLYPEAKVEAWQGGNTGFFRPVGPLVGGLTF